MPHFLQICTVFATFKSTGCAGVLALLTGAIFFIYSVVSLGRSFSPLIAPRRNNELVTSGMYQYMRHPLYAGLLLLAFGLAAVTYSETRLVLALLLQAVLTYKAKKEEESLLERHGESYSEYMKEVDRFFPSL
jgi:protein-S-isoprenylcysteine O-methyltransferase Ste14